VSVARSNAESICATVESVNQPVTERPKVPSVGRLGLVDDRANANLAQLGWNTEECVDVLWSLLLIHILCMFSVAFYWLLCILSKRDMPSFVLWFFPF